jgi:hypothetical protein
LVSLLLLSFHCGCFGFTAFALVSLLLLWFHCFCFRFAAFALVSRLLLSFHCGWFGLGLLKALEEAVLALLAASQRRGMRATETALSNRILESILTATSGRRAELAHPSHRQVRPNSI